MSGAGTFNVASRGKTEIAVTVAPEGTTIEQAAGRPQTILTPQLTKPQLEVVTVGGAPGGKGGKGDKGDKGDKGSSGSAFDYSPPSASATWLIVHNLGYRPSVSVTTSDGEAVGCRVVHLDDSVVSVEFSHPTGGFAHLV